MQTIGFRPLAAIAKRPQARGYLLGQAAILSSIVLLAAALASDIGIALIVAVGLAMIPLMIVLVTSLPLRAWMQLLLASICLNGIRIHVGGYGLLLEHIALLVVVAILLVRLPAAVIRRPAPFEMILLFWILWNVVPSVQRSPRPARSLPIVVWLLFAWAIMWCVRGYLLSSSVEDRNLVQRFVVFAAAATGYLTFALWALALSGGPALGVQPEYLTGAVAARGLSFEANIFGSGLLFVLVFALTMRRIPERPLGRWVIVGISLGIVASMTRAVWIAAALVIVWDWYIAGRRLSRTGAVPGRAVAKSVLVIAVPVVLLIVTLGVSGPFVTKLKGSLDLSSRTAQSRVVATQRALEDLRGSADRLVGLGTNSFGQRHLSPTLRGREDYLANLPLVIVYDSGLIGLALFASGFFAFTVRAGRYHVLRNATMLTLSLVIVGSATNPVWFGVAWVVMAFLTQPGTLHGTDQAVARPDAIW